MSEHGSGHKTSSDLLGRSRKQSLRLTLQNNDLTNEKKKLRELCTHVNYLQLEIDPVLDGFLLPLHLAVHTQKQPATSKISIKLKVQFIGKIEGQFTSVKRKQYLLVARLTQR